MEIINCLKKIASLTIFLLSLILFLCSALALLLLEESGISLAFVLFPFVGLFLGTIGILYCDLRK